MVAQILPKQLGALLARRTRLADGHGIAITQTGESSYLPVMIVRQHVTLFTAVSQFLVTRRFYENFFKMIWRKDIDASPIWLAHMELFFEISRVALRRRQMWETQRTHKN